ncbi:MAG: hypothetical protein JWL63_1532 [Rhodocyclales bacterium]|nr:hypothetical protein [Rhodocyclales bacterium]
MEITSTGGSILDGCQHSRIERESFSIAYVEAIQRRGHIAKFYSPSFSVLLNSVLPPPFTHRDQTEEWYGLDNAIVEFDRNGRVVSALVGAHQASSLLGVRDLEYRTIYMGTLNAKAIENKLSIYLFRDTELRTL